MNDPANDNRLAPLMGTVRDYLGQSYQAIGLRAYARRDGRMTTLVMWQSRCADCGDFFMCLLPAAAKQFQPNRRCLKHKRPGHRVK